MKNINKRIAFDFSWQWEHWHLLPAISLHNYTNQFCIWFNFMGLWFEVIFVKKNWS